MAGHLSAWSLALLIWLALLPCWSDENDSARPVQESRGPVLGRPVRCRQSWWRPSIGNVIGNQSGNCRTKFRRRQQKGRCGRTAGKIKGEDGTYSILRLFSLPGRPVIIWGINFRRLHVLESLHIGIVRKDDFWVIRLLNDRFGHSVHVK